MMRSAWVLAVAGVGLLGATSMAQPLPVPTLGEPSPVFAPSNGVVQGPALGDPTLGDPTLGGPNLGGPVYQPAPGFGSQGFGGPVEVVPGYGPGTPQAVPSQQYQMAPSEPWLAQPMPFSATVPLYPNVRYKQTRNVHPCATQLIVAVKDPRCSRCGPGQCLYVKICVPPCDAPCRVVANRDGSRVHYDWGKYAVTVNVRRNGLVLVDYDD